jgi:exosortase/archaeosortase family protein
VNAHARHALARVGAILLAATAGFLLLQYPARVAETRLTSWLLRWIGAGNVHVVRGASILVLPHGHPSFRAVVSPSCSCLASLIALVCLASITPRQFRGRRPAALGAALATVAIGNILRLTGSIAVGYLAGPTSLVLFHDWVGSVFTFVYTLGGFILMIYLMLPAPSSASPVQQVAT